MKRGLYVGLGVVLLLVGVLLVALGGVIAVSVGSDDAISSPAARLHSAGVAVVAENLAVDGGAVPVPRGLGTLTFAVTARDGRSLFLGAGAPADVRAYLKGAPYSTVVEITDGAPAATRTVPGSQKPASPDAQTFWSQSASGAPAQITARLPQGAALVVMNADAARVVDADLVVTLHVAHAFAYAWAAVAVGVLLVVLAVVLFWRARLAGRRRRDAASGAGSLTPAADTVLPGAPVVVAGAAIPDGAAPARAGAATPGQAEPETDDAVDDAQVAAAPPSAALAALVAEAGGGTAADVTAEVAVVDDSPAPWAGSHAPGTVVVAGAEPVVVPAAVADEEGIDAADPVFDELVSAYGADPVHDALLGEPAGPDAAPQDEQAPRPGEAAERPARPGPATTGG